MISEVPFGATRYPSTHSPNVDHTTIDGITTALNCDVIHLVELNTIKRCHANGEHNVRICGADFVVTLVAFEGAIDVEFTRTQKAQQKHVVLSKSAFVLEFRLDFRSHNFQVTFEHCR